MDEVHLSVEFVAGSVQENVCKSWELKYGTIFLFYFRLNTVDDKKIETFRKGYLG